MAAFGSTRRVNTQQSIPGGTSRFGAGRMPAATPARGNNTLDFMGDRLVGAGGFSTLPGGAGVSASGSRMPSVIMSNSVADPARNAAAWATRNAIAGGAGTAAGSGGATTNYAAPDPRVSEMANLWRNRLAELNDPRYTDLSISRATGDIMDRATGARDVATENAARLGRLGSGGEKVLHTGIDEAAKRLAARAGTDIRLGHESMKNSFLLGGAPIMEAPARLALAQQGLGITQRGQDIQERESVASRDDARLATMLSLMRNPPPTYAYAGGY